MIQKTESAQQITVREEIFKKTGYNFKELSLLNRALDQSGDLHRQKDHQDLENLGDWALNSALTHLVLKVITHPVQEYEAQMRQLIDKLSNNDKLKELSDRSQLGVHFRSQHGNRSKAGDFIEALLGAAYLDGGGMAVSRIVSKLYGSDLEPKNVLSSFALSNEQRVEPDCLFRSYRESMLLLLSNQSHEENLRLNIDQVFGRILLRIGAQTNEDIETFKQVCAVASSRDVVHPLYNRLNLALRGEAALRVRLLAREFDSAGIRPSDQPLRELREEFTKIMSSGYSLIDNAMRLIEIHLKSRTGHCSSRHLYFAFLGAALELRESAILEMEAVRIEIHSGTTMIGLS